MFTDARGGHPFTHDYCAIMSRCGVDDIWIIVLYVCTNEEPQISTERLEDR